MTRWVIYALVAAAVLGFFGESLRRSYNNGYAKGQTDLVASIEARNAEAGRAAKERVHEANRCDDVGGTWDWSRGACVANGK